MIEFEQVCVDFASRGTTVRAVDNVSLHIDKGDFYGIVGPSGAGKSTLVRTVNLLQRPSAGRVRINGEDITDLQGRRLSQLRLKIGMIFQHFNLIANTTVAGNIAFALKAAGVPKAQRTGRIDELLDAVGLAQRKDVYPSSLSGGQKQRVAIARALANHPEILLCDEATSALDPDNTQEVIKVLRDIKKRYPLTVLFITHQMEVARALFDHIAVMDAGKVVESADSYSLFAAPQHAVTQKLVQRSLSLGLPPEAIQHESEVYVITYTGESSYEPLISAVSRRFEVNVPILAGRIEYIQGKPLGILAVSIHGRQEACAQAVAFLKEQPGIALRVYRQEENV